MIFLWKSGLGDLGQEEHRTGVLLILETKGGVRALQNIGKELDYSDLYERTLQFGGMHNSVCKRDQISLGLLIAMTTGSQGAWSPGHFPSLQAGTLAVPPPLLEQELVGRLLWSSLVQKLQR